MSNAAKFMFMMILATMLFDTGNFGAVASTQEIASSMGAAQTGRYTDGVAVVPNGLSPSADARSANVALPGSGGLTDDSRTDNLADGQVTSDLNTGNIVQIPSADGTGWGTEGLALMNTAMMNFVSPAGYGAVVLMRKFSPALVLATATPYPTSTPYPAQATLTPRPTLTQRGPYPTSTAWPTVYITETPVNTSTPVIVPTSTNTPVNTPTATNTTVLVPTDTETPEPTLTPRPTYTPEFTPTPYPTATEYPTVAPLPTYTPVPPPTPIVLPFGS